MTESNGYDLYLDTTARLRSAIADSGALVDDCRRRELQVAPEVGAVLGHHAAELVVIAAGLAHHAARHDDLDSAVRILGDAGRWLRSARDSRRIAESLQAVPA